ncbi:MAG: SRPBCC domain-containing protein [Arthrobacter sp.]
MTTDSEGDIDAENRSVRFVRHYALGREDLWQAFTDPQRLARWLGAVTGDMREHGRYGLDFGDDETTTGRITTCREPDQLTATWESPGEGTTQVDVHRSDTGTDTRVVLTHASLRPEDLPGYAAGWHTHLDHLDTDLNGHRASGWSERYNELLPRNTSHGPGVPATGQGSWAKDAPSLPPPTT